MTKLFFLILSSIILLTACDNSIKKVVYYHPEGYYKEVFFIKNDSVKEGKYLKYYANDVLADSCWYIDNEIHGERKIFSEKGQVEIMESYNHGIFEGPYITYYSNGQIKKIQYYIDNKIQGEIKEFHSNGKIKAITQMVDNLENGSFREYFENGQLHWEGFYQNGDFEQDTLKEFNREGKLTRKLFCDKGICQTVWTPEKGYIQQKEIFE